MTETRVHVRWMINRDMSEILEIENEVYLDPWTKEDFLETLRSRNCIGMVAETEHKVIGYVLYILERRRFTVMRITVDPSYHRSRVGAQMIEKVKAKLSQNKRSVIRADAPESNLRAQLFLKAMGFQCLTILEEDMTLYRFEYRLEAA